MGFPQSTAFQNWFKFNTLFHLDRSCLPGFITAHVRAFPVHSCLFIMKKSRALTSHCKPKQRICHSFCCADHLSFETHATPSKDRGAASFQIGEGFQVTKRPQAVDPSTRPHRCTTLLFLFCHTGPGM